MTRVDVTITPALLNSSIFLMFPRVDGIISINCPASRYGQLSGFYEMRGKKGARLATVPNL
jgi:hypothetical protein